MYDTIDRSIRELTNNMNDTIPKQQTQSAVPQAPPPPPKQPPMLLPSFAEARAVLEVSRPFPAATQQPGEEWFAVNAKWIESWLAYTGCPRERIVAPDEAQQRADWFSFRRTTEGSIAGSLSSGTASLATSVSDIK
jgi:hypothetical protein